jgi:DNA-binding NarL/FixJ family response regulator
MARSGLPYAGREVRLPARADVPFSCQAAASCLWILNEREAELLACFETGLLYKEIEGRLHLSHTALRKRQHRLYAKLGAQNRTEGWHRSALRQ